MINEQHPQLDLDPNSRTLEPNSQPQLFSTKPLTMKYTLKSETVHKLVNQSIGSIALECGYHIANQSSLEILTDVCCDYLKKMSTLFRDAYDTEELRDSESDFVDCLERVFHQVNVPSAANLHQFTCKMQAIKKHQTKQQAQQII